MPVILLALVVLLALYSRRFPGLPNDPRIRPRQPKSVMRRDSEPFPGWIGDVLWRARRTRIEADRTMPEVLSYVDDFTRSRINDCQQLVTRYQKKGKQWDFLEARRCKQPLCPHCGIINHMMRARYEAQKIASLDCTKRFPDNPQLVNVVFSIPPALHADARQHPSVLPLVLKAIRTTIAGAYGYKPKGKRSAEQNCWRSMGAIVHLHAIGDKGEPWPKWQPHFDILIPAFVRKGDQIKPLRSTWGEPYAKTHARYRMNLRRHLLPLYQSGPLRSVERQAFLASEFDVQWNVSRPPRGAGRGIIHTRSAMHRITYSCRPLVQLHRAYMEHDTRGSPWLCYEPPSGRRTPTILHRIPPGPAFGQIRSLHPFLFGRESKCQMGLLHGEAYRNACALLEREPVRERDSRGAKAVAVYALEEDERSVEKLDVRTLRPIKTNQPFASESEESE